MELTDAKALADTLIETHLGYGSGWKFGWNRAKRAFGMCDHRTKTIELSALLTPLQTEEHVTDTILHEIAHAKVGSKHGHDAVWKAACREVGARPQRTGTGAILERPYTASCPNGHTLHRHRRTDLSRYCCGTCGGKFGSWVDSRALAAVS